MITAGCDVGSLTSKAVIMKDNRIVAQEVIRSRTKPAESAVAVMDCALQKAGMTLADITFCVGTGYGRDRIPFVQEAVSEISCHARGARWLLPTVKTVIDIGGQDCKAMRIDKDGKIVKFITNDKCASGTGRFLEVMARLINVSLDDLGELSARAKAPITMANACTVWAQADVIQHLNDGLAAEDIGAGINNAMASRMAVLANNIGLERDLCMTGGVAKNTGVVTALEKLLGMTIKRIKKVDPQLVGAVGAALIAGDKMEKGGAS
jgi:(R)-2-hydroxyacyl-CoA dehydratese activating ATPase